MRWVRRACRRAEQRGGRSSTTAVAGHACALLCCAVLCCGASPRAPRPSFASTATRWRGDELGWEGSGATRRGARATHRHGVGEVGVGCLAVQLHVRDGVLRSDRHGGGAIAVVARRGRRTAPALRLRGSPYPGSRHSQHVLNTSPNPKPLSRVPETAAAIEPCRNRWYVRREHGSD